MEVARLELEFRRPGGSPTDMLLTNWGHSNATVEMLVSHLLRAGLRFAAEKLRGLGLLALTWFLVTVRTTRLPKTERPEFISHVSISCLVYRHNIHYKVAQKWGQFLIAVISKMNMNLD